MTPQQKAMSALLHTSLFKWAESAHNTLAELRERGHDEGELEEIGRKVERYVDAAIQEANGAPIAMKKIEDINAQIVKMKNVLRD